ncbi:MAG: hypothetical protein PHY93_16805, partial [Bacteriovorax sp.]|nr:hypothetical protein [Bacteriovorax sp.]
VELMVVVAIIGILSAIAVPNFKKYQAKAKQSEAKIQLAAVYSSEVGASADYDTYATCLVTLGYEQSPRGYYRIGFSAPYDAAATGKITADCGPGAAAGIAGNQGTPAITTDISMSPLLHLSGKNNYPAAITDGQTIVQPGGLTFKAGAEGQISGSAGVDVWVINNTKALGQLGPAGY